MVDNNEVNKRSANYGWYYSDNIHKRRLVSYYAKVKSYIYYRPISFIGKLTSMAINLTPVELSSCIKENIQVDIKMPDSDVRVVVDGFKDISRSRFFYKERSTVCWIERYYTQGDIIFDVGANIGAVSLISANFLQKKCKIYAFEPLPTTFSMLFKNIMKNQFGHVITPLNMALSDKSKVEDFFMTSTDAGSSGYSIYRGSSGSTQESYKKLEIFTTTIR